MSDNGKEIENLNLDNLDVKEPGVLRETIPWRSTMITKRRRVFTACALLAGFAACSAAPDDSSLDSSSKSTGARPPFQPGGMIDPQGNRVPVDSPLFPYPFDPLADEGSDSNHGVFALGAACPTAENFIWKNPATVATNAADLSTGILATCNRAIEVGYTAGNVLQPQLPNSGKTDLFIRSLGMDGVPKWTKQLGTAGNDLALAVAGSNDCAAGSFYVAGYSDAGFGGPSAGSYDAILLKLDADGDEIWRRQFGTTGSDQAFAVAVGPDNSVYVAGSTGGNFDQPDNRTNGTTSLFLAKYAADGTPGWRKQLLSANTKTTVARGVAVGADGKVYVTGYTNGGLNGMPAPQNGTDDEIALRYNATTGALEKLVYLGTPQFDRGYGLVTHQENGNTFLYSVGYTLGSTVAGFTNPNKRYNALVYKLDTDLVEVWHQQTKVSGSNVLANSITIRNDSVSAIDPIPYIAIAGSTANDLNDLTLDAPLYSQDMYVLEYDTNGNAQKAEYIGNNAREAAYGISASPNGSLFLAGTSDASFCGATFGGGGMDAVPVRLLRGCEALTSSSRCPCGGGSGDPHYYSFDGKAFDFQASGDFVLATMADNPDFVVQARQCGSHVAVFQGVAAKVLGDTVEIDGSGQIYINGTLTPMPAKGMLALETGAVIYGNPATGPIIVGWPSGERLMARAYGSSMNLGLLVPKSRTGQMRGLLGDADQNGTNEFMLSRDGNVRSPSLSFRDMYKGAGNLASVWRVGSDPADTTLIQQGTSCDNPNLPAEPRWLNNLTPQELAQGEALCAAITCPTMKETCILDVGLTGDPTLATAAVENAAWMCGHKGNTPVVAEPRTVYWNDFQGAVGSEWDTITASSTPLGDHVIMGPFANETVQLSLQNLQAHNELIVSFDLFIINGWDGDGALGPSNWKAAIDGIEGANYSFSNTYSQQSYPTFGSMAQQGAIEANTLFYPYGDSIYRIRLAIPHTGSTASLELSGEGLSGFFDEGWGMTNFEVQGH